jgi:hypothetical protein
LLTENRYIGSGGAGHWKIYIRDFKKDQWRCYNDRHVTNVTREEIFKERKVHEGAAPLVAYVLDDAKNELIQPVYRIRPEPGTEGDGDMIMGESPITGGVTLHHSDPFADAGTEYDGPIKSLLD